MEQGHLRAVEPAEAEAGSAGSVSSSAAPSPPTKAVGDRVDPEVLPSPKRRSFTAEFKRQVLAEADAGTEPVGELLRRHGLYSSHLTEWRRQRDEGLKVKKRGRKTNVQRALLDEVAQLKREKAQLEEELRKAAIIIDVQKKLSQVLGIKMPPMPTLSKRPSEDDE